MKITPMIGELTLEGVEYVESSERLALVEHRVPGLKGNYFQQLGSVPNAIVVRGTRYGDDARDTFLTGIREIFNKAEPTTFVADINTATDITDVLLEDLHFAESAGGADVLQYEIRIRKYVKPPDPPKTDALDTGILDDAGSALDALDTLDALASAPDLGDPTPPLNEALKSVEGATSELPAILESVSALTEALPSSQPSSPGLTAIVGDKVSGTGVGGVLEMLKSLDGKGLSVSLSAKLGDTFDAKVSASSPAGMNDGMTQVTSALAAIPKEPTSLIAPLTSKLDGITGLSTTDLVAHLRDGLKGMDSLRSAMPESAASLLGDVVARLGSFKSEFLQGEFSELREWSDSVSGLYKEIEPLLQGTGSVEDRLLGYLRGKIESLIALILPDGSVHGELIQKLETALSVDIVAEIAGLRASLIESLQLAKVDCDAGNFTNTAHLAAAQVAFQGLTARLSDFTASLRPAFGLDVTSPDFVAARLEELYDHFRAVNIIELGDVREKFAKAIRAAEQKVRDFDLSVVQETVGGLFDKVDAAIGDLHLDVYSGKLDSIRQQIDSLLGKLDGALLECLAAMRKVFTQIRDAIRSLAGKLGSYDDSGKFHFNVEQQLVGFLQDIRKNLHETIEPVIQQFRTTVSGVLGQIQSALGAITGEIEKVQAQLKDSLDQVHAQLQSVDVEGTMASIRDKLEELLGKLGTVDFDIVVNPVIDQINSMAQSLKKINVSAMSEISVGALKVSFQVVASVDFSAKITDALMAQFDELLAMPKDALAQVQGKVEASIKQFGAVAPQAMLAPLIDLFAPVQAQLDALSLGNLLKPLDEWHAKLEASLDRISPAALLQPLLDLFGKLEAAIGALSPQALVAPVQGAIDQLKAQIVHIDLHGAVSGLESGFDALVARFDSLSPAQLLNPLAKGFDTIMQALDAFSPAALLEPFNALFGKLGVLLHDLTTEQVRLISAVFDGLREAVAAFDPDGVYKVLREKFSAVGSVTAKLDIGGLMSSIRGPFEALNASFSAKAGPADVSLKAQVAVLNPLKDPSFGEVVSDIQSFQAKIQAMSTAQPPAALVARYKEIKESVEAIVPVWANSGISADSVRRAFEAASPLNLKQEIDGLYGAFEDKVRAFDPREIQRRLQGTFDRLKQLLLSFDPRKLVAEVQGVVASVGSRLDAIDLKLIGAELQSVADEIRNVVSGLDPKPIVAQLQGLMDEVKGAVAELKPSALLADLAPTLDKVRDIVQQFSPARFIAEIQSLFDEIQALLLKIDLTEVLSPITDRLDDLRDKLEAALRKTETAFNGMLAAAPV